MKKNLNNGRSTLKNQTTFIISYLVIIILLKLYLSGINLYADEIQTIKSNNSVVLDYLRHYPYYAGLHFFEFYKNSFFLMGDTLVLATMVGTLHLCYHLVNTHVLNFF